MRGVTFEEGSAEKVFGNLSELMDVVQYDWYIDDLDLNYIGFRSGKCEARQSNYQRRI